MPLLTASRISMSFKGEPVLAGVTLSLEEGRRYGLVGPNGSGKTTLVRILAGDLQPEEGTVHVARDARVVYLPQRPDLTPGRTVFAEVMTAFRDLEEMERTLRALEERIGADDRPPDELAAIVDRHARLTEEFGRRGGWDRERTALRALHGLGVPDELVERDVATLSGGQATRVSLARALLRGPDLLVLDEPTNHLDIDAVEWLEGELIARRGATLVISHDRWFLDRVAETTFELEATRLWSYPGNYSKFEILRQGRREREQKAFDRQRTHIEKEEEFIRRNIAAQATSMAKGKRKRLERIERIEGPARDRPRMVIPGEAPPEVHGGDVVDLRGIGVSLGGKRVLSDVDLRVATGSCVGVVGPNGAGKTTLLRVATGDLGPDAGTVERARNLRVGFLSQEPLDLEPGSTVLERILVELPYATDGECRSWLARFLFRGDEVEKDVGDLSGGEAARLALALLLLERPNFLVLDEPTNHLDIAARQALESALAGFEGTVLLVSHDRYLLQGTADRILEIRPEGHFVTEGDWSAHVKRRVERREEGREDRAASRPRRERTETKPGHLRNPYKFARLEEDLMAREERRDEILRLMETEEVYLDPDALRALKDELPAVEGEMRRLSREWEDWTSE